MIKKSFNILNLALAISLSLFSFNVILSKLDPNQFFPTIFICLGFSDAYIGINLLNSNKKILSFFSFLLATFFFVMVGSKILIYG